MFYKKYRYDWRTSKWCQLLNLLVPLLPSEIKDKQRNSEYFQRPEAKSKRREYNQQVKEGLRRVKKRSRKFSRETMEKQSGYAQEYYKRPKVIEKRRKERIRNMAALDFLESIGCTIDTTFHTNRRYERKQQAAFKFLKRRRLLNAR